jgi:hypothetical protein
MMPAACCAAGLSICRDSLMHGLLCASDPRDPCAPVIVTHVLSQVPDPMARYKQLLFYAAKLPPMTAEQHKPENKVEGCVSQVRRGANSIRCINGAYNCVFWRVEAYILASSSPNQS